jgi:hypothetical protein
MPTSVAPRRAHNVIVIAVVLAWIPAMLVLDHGWGGTAATLVQERWLGVCTWLVLLALLRFESSQIRVQVAVVVAFATLIEYVFSYELHVYVYRLHDVPWFVPPGHGMVYLAALAIGRAPEVVRHSRVLIPVTLIVAGTYAVWGLFFSGREDLLGMLWFGCLAGFLLFGRQPTVFIGAFVVVTYLELLGTHLGIWSWQVRDPIAHLIPMGNPPSGAAGGYGFFDAAALALAPRIGGFITRLRRPIPVARPSGLVADPAEQVVMKQAVAAHDVAAVAALDA